MKRIACVLCILCLLPVAASADRLGDFNLYAQAFGEPILSGGQDNGKYTVYESDGCRISFQEGETVRIYVEGDGIPFLAYAMAAVMAFDPSAGNYTRNAGRFFSLFLLSRSDTETHAEYTETGGLMGIRRKDSGFLFYVGK